MPYKDLTKRVAVIKRWKTNNREEYLASEKRRRDAMPRRKKYDKHLRATYGITIEDYDQMYDAQYGLCKICKKPEELHVDHDHSNERIRGLLCNSCNNLLRCAKDNVLILESAIRYLKGS